MPSRTLIEPVAALGDPAGHGRARRRPLARRDHHGRQRPLGARARHAAGARPPAGAEALRRTVEACRDLGIR